jgi:hypothetical protein
LHLFEVLVGLGDLQGSQRGTLHGLHVHGVNVRRDLRLQIGLSILLKGRADLSPPHL